jgi:histone-like DNA-binding protein
MANKPLQFVIVERKLAIGKHAGKVMQIAKPTGRHRIDFRNFCERVAKSTTFNRQEVEAVLNYATEIAKDIVANGDIVDFGDLGTLMPSFKSKAVEKGQTFNANIHIEKPVVFLQPSKKYFTLTDVSYEQTTVKPKEKKPKTKPKTNEGGTPPENGGHIGA